MNEATDNRETEALIQGYLDGSLTEHEGSRMLAFLQRDPSLVGEILDGLRMDCLIRTVAAEAAASVSLVAERKVLLLPTAARAFRSLAHDGSWRRPRRPMVLALAACIAVLLGLSIWYFGPTMGEPMLAEVKGVDVSIERGTEFVPGANGIRLQATDVLHVGTNASATITFDPENTWLELHADTELSLAHRSKGKHFALRSGKLEANVARQRPFKPMLVRTPQAEARVLGTQFTLTVTNNETRLDVAEGEVRFTRVSDGTHVDVPADYYAIAAGNVKLAALPQTGSILREYWTNIPGDYYTTLLTTHPDYPDRPAGQQYLDKFEAPSNWGTNYGARFRGFVHPPITGGYTFYIAASDGGEFFLSRDDNPQNRAELASAEYSGPLEWTKLGKQQSSAVPLTAGRRYYVEVLKKQGNKSRDHLAVAWKRPDGKFEIIPGDCLSPFKPKPKEKKL